MQYVVVCKYAMSVVEIGLSTNCKLPNFWESVLWLDINVTLECCHEVVTLKQKLKKALVTHLDGQLWNSSSYLMKEERVHRAHIHNITQPHNNLFPSLLPFRCWIWPLSSAAHVSCTMHSQECRLCVATSISKVFSTTNVNCTRSNHLPPSQRNVVATYGTWNHRLAIGIGRWLTISRDNRSCHFCSHYVVETGEHFMLKCPLCNPLEDKFQSLFENVVSNRESRVFLSIRPPHQY